MTHYMVNGIKVPHVREPNVGEIMYGETMAGKGVDQIRGAENLVFQFVVSIRRFPELRDDPRYTWAAIVDPDNGLSFEVISPIEDKTEEPEPEMIPDPTEPGDETGGSGSFENIQTRPLPDDTGNTSGLSDSTSVGDQPR